MVRSRQLNGKEIFVVDDVSDPRLVRLLHDALKSLPFVNSEYSNEETESIKYFNHEFDIKAFARHPLFGFLYKAVTDLADRFYGMDTFKLSRIHCNNQRHG